MRLLHTTSLSLNEYHGDKVPKYAILSHCWNESGEVTFDAFQSGKGVELSGHSNIEGACSKAAKDGWEFVWIDSCCINKDSSSELSEAINSMFRWYREAEICYVYMADVLITTNNNDKRDSQLRKSKLFTRGWTLQELLAPKVAFFDREWNAIGQKDDLHDLLSSITGVQDLNKFEDACVAVKMSWASKGNTTRIEDEAYCLMGLFGVYMTPIYGEGTNAFLRLLECTKEQSPMV
ncbi:HET-domain-containing protein [Leptodontidium sp. MPI-SDFR-AT-0119]|nr:HET-domain-containing protein [Leptodontidium sp. MPI-SDFR-AT-0119]